MLKRLKTVSMMLFLMGASTGAAFATPATGVDDVKITQQSGTATGTVVDAMGPVIGASVVVKGTTNGVITDFDGNFSLSNVKKGDIIQISFVGYATQEIAWDGKPLNITLKEDTELLDEVVVVGYGTQKKVNVTGAVAMTEGDVLENRPIANIAQGLQGAIPNLNISFGSGSPTSTAKMNVRGLTSINGGSALILVDGVETNDISLLNPQDIENISVLKDASSAAVYGARAAFGVVLITTKKGTKEQKVKVNYSNNFSWSAPSRLPEGINSYKWIQACNLANYNNSGSNCWSDELVEALRQYSEDPTRPVAFLDERGVYTGKGEWAYAGSTDWFDTMYKDAAFMQQHNASISGGTEKNTYYASLGYKGQDGLLAYGNDTYNRFNMTFNFTTQVTDWLELGFRTKYNRNTSDEPNTQDYMGSSPYYEIYRSHPFVPMFLPDGQGYAGINGSNFNYNFVAIMAEGGRVKNTYDDFWYTGSFTLTPIKGLSIKGDYTRNRFFRSRRAHFKEVYQTMPDGSLKGKGITNNASLTKYDDTYEALNAWAEYKTTLGEHSLGIMAGYNQEKKETGSLYGTSSGLYANDFPIIGQAKTKQELYEKASVWAVQGVFFRLNYDYKGKYLLELNGRYDGSSKYHSDDRWGFFPSASLGWRTSEENFFEPLRETINNLKVRASYGTLGNQVTTGNFDYIGSMGSRTMAYILGSNQATGITPASLATRNVTWEKVTTANFGLDLGFFNNRLNATFDYFIRYTDDMVVSKAYPSVMGTSGGKENLASMRTNGWELAINWRDVIEDVAGSPLEYSVGFGLSDSYSTITKYDNPTGFFKDNELYEGKRLGEIWGFVTDGFIVDAEEAALQATRQKEISGSWLPGDIRYADLDGDKKITFGDNTLKNPGDQKVIGNQTPRYRFSFNLGGSWKGFDIRAQFEGVGKRDLWLSNDVFWGFTGQWHGAVNDYHVDNMWTPENTNAYYPVATWNGRSRQVQTKYLQDASYIRLRDLTIGYTLPQSWLKPLGVSQFKIFASGQNLWEATDFYKYVDPDMTGSANNKGVFEGDMKAYPFCRSYSFGVNLTF